MVKFLGATMLAAAMALTSLVAMADGEVRDASADSAAFLEQVEAGNGVIIRVPVNAEGQEYAAGAEMRLHAGDTAIEANGADIVDAWGEAEDLGDQPLVSDDEVTDASTWGWYGWRYRGWARPYYYYNYRPRAYFYGTRYAYARPYYYTSYGYRYYYYNCYW